MYTNPFYKTFVFAFKSFVSHYNADGSLKPFEEYRIELIKYIDNEIIKHKFDIIEKDSSNAIYLTAEKKLTLGLNDFWNFSPFKAVGNFISAVFYLWASYIKEYTGMNPILYFNYKFEGFPNYGDINYSKFNSDKTLKDPIIYEYQLRSVSDKFYYDHKILSEYEIISNMTYATMNAVEVIKDIGSILFYAISLPFRLMIKAPVYLISGNLYSVGEELVNIPKDMMNFSISLYNFGIDSLATGVYLVFGIRSGLNNILNLVSSGFKITADVTNLIGKGFGYLTSYIGEDAAKAVEKLFEMVSNIFLVTDASLKFAYHICSLQWISAINDAYDFVSHIFKIPTDGISAVYHTFSQIYKAIEYVVQPIYPIGSYIFDLGKDLILYFVDKTIEYLTPVIETANEHIKYFKDILNENYTHLSDKVSNFTKDAINSLTELKAIYANNLSNWLEELKTGCSKSISNFKDNAENAYEWMWSSKSKTETQPQEEYTSDEIIVADESWIKNSFIKIIETLKSSFSLDSIYKLFDTNLQTIENIQEAYNIPEGEIYIETSPEKLALFKQKSYINDAKDLIVSLAKNLNNIKEDSKEYFSKWWNKEDKIIEQQPKQPADLAEELNYDNIEIAKNIILPQEEIEMVSYYNKLPSLNLPNLQEIIVNPIYEWWHKNDAQIIPESNINNEEYEIIPTGEVSIAGESVVI